MSMAPDRPRLTNLDQLRLAFYWMASHILWGALMTFVVQNEMERMAPEFKARFTGITLGIGSIAAVVIPLLIGPLSDRCRHPLGRRRPFILWGTALCVLGIGGLAVSSSLSSIPLFIGAFFFTNLGNNVATAAYSGLIPDIVPVEDRGSASGWMAVMSQSGTLIGMVLGAFLSGGATTLLILYGLLAGALIHALIVTIRGVKETPLTQVIPMPKFAEYLRSLLEPFKSADFRWVWITRALVVMGFYTVQPYLKFFVGDVLKPSDVSTGTLLIGAVVLISAALAGYFGGKLSDKIGRKRTVIWANSLMGVVCVGFAAIVSFPLAIAAAVLFGATYGAYYSVDWALGTDVLPNLDDAGKDMAVWHVAMTLPTSLSAPIAAYAIESGGVTKTLVDGETVFRYQHSGYVALFILAAVYVLLGAFFLRRVKGST